MQTVVETPGYLADAKDEGMTEAEMRAVVELVAEDPKAGDLIVGSGGCRKLRVAGKGRGKSGGYRVVTFFAGEDVPVFLLAVLAKGSRANFTAAECALMKKAAKAARESLGPRAAGGAS